MNAYSAGDQQMLGSILSKGPSWQVRPPLLLGVVALLASCSSPTTPTSQPTSVEQPRPVSTPTPTPTPTPFPVCAVRVSSSAFEPGSINCPGGTSSGFVRLVFSVSAFDVPITINKVSSSGVTCRIVSGATCGWGEANLSYSPKLVEKQTTAQIVATEAFTCTARGDGRTGIELVFAKLFVNTSCGSFESTVTNRLLIGF